MAADVVPTSDRSDGAAPADLAFAVFSHIAQKESATIAQRLDEFAAEVRLADRLGYDYFFTTEHHFSGRFSLAPSQPVSLTTIVHNSERMRFGPMVVQLPISQPLRVVEEMLILDHMSHGRLDIGLGRGITPHEHTTFGIPTHTDYARFNEGLEFVVKALTTAGRFSWVGEFYTYVDIELPWPPLQLPHPPIWIPTNTPATAYEYGKRGFGIGGFAIVGTDLYERVFAEYRRGCDEADQPASERRVSYLASTIVAETDAEADRLLREHLPHQIALFEHERHRSLEVLDVASQRATHTSLERFARIKGDIGVAAESCRVIHGSPETVARKIRHLQDLLGINVYIGEFSFGELSWDQVAQSHELFASEVMPALSAGRSVGASA